MDSAVFVESYDDRFAEIISKTLKLSGIPVKWTEDGGDILTRLADKTIGVVLLDIRNHYEKALEIIQIIKQSAPEVEVLLINRPYNIWIAVEGMKVGASDEITVPIDTDVLMEKVVEARNRVAKTKTSLLKTFSNAMTASTFAEAGEFDTAISMLSGADVTAENGVPEKNINRRQKTKCHNK